MMFLSHVSFALELIALVLGTSLFLWAQRNKGAGQGFAKGVGSVVIVLSILSMLCISYYSVKYWLEGYFNTPHPMMTMMGQRSMMGMDQSGMLDKHDMMDKHGSKE